MPHHGRPSAAFLFEASRTLLVRNFCEFQNLGLIWLGVVWIVAMDFDVRFVP